MIKTTSIKKKTNITQKKKEKKNLIQVHSSTKPKLFWPKQSSTLMTQGKSKLLTHTWPI